MVKCACGSRVVVLIKNISQCWGDGSHYKLWDSYQFQQDLKLEALTWTVRHLQTSASPYRICTSEVPLLNVTSILNRKKHNPTFCESEFFCHSKGGKKQAFVWKVPFAFALWLVCTSKSAFFLMLNSSFWNKTVDIHLLHRMHLVIHKLAMRPELTHKRAICSTIITSTTTSLNKTIRPSVL